MQLTVQNFTKQDFLRMLQTEVGHLSFSPMFSDVLGQVLEKAFHDLISETNKKIIADVGNVLSPNKIAAIKNFRDVIAKDSRVAEEFYRSRTAGVVLDIHREGFNPNPSGYYVGLCDAKVYVEKIAGL